MANNFGGLIMFGLGKQKLVEGIELKDEHQTTFVQLFNAIKQQIHLNEQINCSLDFLPVFIPSAMEEE